MPTTITSQTAVRDTSPSSAGAFGYLDRDGHFISSIVADSPIGTATPEATSEKLEEHPPIAVSELPIDPRELITMAFYTHLSSLEPGLLLGDLDAASSTRYRTDRRISHVVSVCKNPVPADWAESGQRQLRIPIDDEDHEDLLIHMRGACEFIYNALEAGGTVIIHSERGQSRSAAIAAAFYMWRDGLGATEALERVRMAREQIWCKPGFQEQLILFGLSQYAPSPDEGIYRGWRARRDQAIAEVEARRQLNKH